MDDNAPPPNALSTEDALVAIMIAVSAADQNMTTPELVSIQRMIAHLPIFGSYDADRVSTVAQVVFDLLEEEDGLDALFGLVGPALPEEINETAYAFACDVAASDGKIEPPELRILEEIRYELNIDRLHAAAIERGSRARHLRLPAPK